VEKLEASYKKNLDVEQVWVYGNSFKSCLVAVVVPTKEAAEKWAKGAAFSGSFAEICANKDFADSLCKDLQATGGRRLLAPSPGPRTAPAAAGCRCCCWGLDQAPPRPASLAARRAPLPLALPPHPASTPPPCAGKADKLKGFELVKGVMVEAEMFSVDNELLTPSFKLKRPQLQKKYQALIDAMYLKLDP
jgi:long-chain acyl-CoA synthetase